MTTRLDENENQQSNKRGILVREDLEYSAQKIFTYSAIGLTAIAVYASVVYLVVQQLKK
jgi:hypothetical protein